MSLTGLVRNTSASMGRKKSARENLASSKAFWRRPMMYSNLGRAFQLLEYQIWWWERLIWFKPPPPSPHILLGGWGGICTTPTPHPGEETCETFVQSKPQREDGSSQHHCIQLKKKNRFPAAPAKSRISTHIWRACVICNYPVNFWRIWRAFDALENLVPFSKFAKLWKWVKTLKMGQNFETGSKLWKWVNILKMGKHFENG